MNNVPCPALGLQVSKRGSTTQSGQNLNNNLRSSRYDVITIGSRIYTLSIGTHIGDLEWPWTA